MLSLLKTRIVAFEVFSRTAEHLVWLVSPLLVVSSMVTTRYVKSLLNRRSFAHTLYYRGFLVKSKSCTAFMSDIPLL